MKRYFFALIFTTLAAVCSCTAVHAQTGIDLVASTSGFGFDSGVGLQLDSTGEYWDVQATVMDQPKLTGSGHRFLLQAVGRYPINSFAIEAGINRSSYDTEFDGGRVWTETGTSPMVGVAYVGDFEATFRYAFKDNTKNETRGLYLGGEMPCGRFVCGATVRYSQFDQSGETDSDVALMFEWGWRFKGL